MLVPLLVETVVEDLGVRTMGRKVVPLVASIVVLVKLPLMLFLVVALALRHDSKPLLSAEGLLLSSLLLEAMAGQEREYEVEQEREYEVEQEGGGLIDQHTGDIAYEDGREHALEVALGEE